VRTSHHRLMPIDLQHESLPSGSKWHDRAERLHMSNDGAQRPQIWPQPKQLQHWEAWVIVAMQPRQKLRDPSSPPQPVLRVRMGRPAQRRPMPPTGLERRSAIHAVLRVHLGLEHLAWALRLAHRNDRDVLDCGRPGAAGLSEPLDRRSTESLPVAGFPLEPQSAALDLVPDRQLPAREQLLSAPVAQALLLAGWQAEAASDEAMPVRRYP
jgi:hypothetical protein